MFFISLISSVVVLGLITFIGVKVASCLNGHSKKMVQFLCAVAGVIWGFACMSLGGAPAIAGSIVAGGLVILWSSSLGF